MWSLLYIPKIRVSAKARESQGSPKYRAGRTVILLSRPGKLDCLKIYPLRGKNFAYLRYPWGDTSLDAVNQKAA